MGWWGADATLHSIYTYSFNDYQKSLYNRVISDTKFLGCRDYHTVNVLRNNGFDSTLMTGCPAWYNLEYVNKINYTGPDFTKVNNICISDCSNPDNLPLLMEVLKYVRNFFPNANINLIFHRGLIQNIDLSNIITNNNISVIDISQSQDGFKYYDSCDLHIGFRVHAHIYNLSIRHASILIEEDSRGNGTNSALGLDSIKTKILTSYNNVQYEDNIYITLQLDDTILKLHSTNYHQFSNAYKIMNDSFKKMEYHIKSISQYI